MCCKYDIIGIIYKKIGKTALVFVGLVVCLAVNNINCTANQTPTGANNSEQASIQSVADSKRLELEQQLGNPVPSLNIFIQTPLTEIFASSSDCNSPAVTPDSYFRFASNTKTFTATAILKMYQDGWLDIKAKIIDSIPGSTTPYVPDSPIWNIPHKNDITIEQLLQHSAGVYDVDNDVVPGCDGKSYTGYQLSLDAKHQFTVDEFAEQLTLNNLSYFPPGTDYHYSNTGYAILSRIISRIYSYRAKTSKNYSDYLTDYISGPNAKIPLDSIHFPVLATNEALPDPFIAGTIRYADKSETYSSFNMSGQVGEGNGYGTMRDLNKFIRTLMSGNNVLTPATVKLMQTDRTPSKQPISYSLGCFFVENLGYGHNGARIGYLSCMFYQPNDKVSVIILLPLIDVSKGDDTFLLCIKKLNDTALAAKSALGYTDKSIN